MSGLTVVEAADPTGLWSSNNARGRVEKESARKVFDLGVAACEVGTMILARGFWAWNDRMDVADALTVEIEKRKGGTT